MFFIPAIREWLAHPGFQKYFKNISWLFSTRIITIGFSLITNIIVVRYLGPTNNGIINYAVSFVGIFAFMNNLSADQVLMRDLVQFKEQRDTYLGTAFTLKFCSGLIAAMLSIFFSFLISAHDISFFLIGVISLTYIFNSWNIINLEFQADVQSKYPSLIAFSINIFLSLLKLSIVFFHKGIIYFSLVLLLEPICFMILYIYFHKKKYGNIFSWNFDKTIAFSMIHNSWPLMFSSAFALVFARIDQVLIKNMLSATENGYYAAGVTLAEGSYFIQNLIVPAFFPAIINAKKISEASYYKRLWSLAGLLAGLSAALAIILNVLAKYIIVIFYGKEFAPAIPILQIYVWGGISTALGLLAVHYLVAENYRKINFFVSLITMIANVCLNLLFIPRFGIIGSAWATFFSYLLLPVSLLFFKETRTKIVKSFFALLRQDNSIKLHD